VLVERGALAYDTPIVELWPEFGANGKQAATVRHALTHTVGVPGLPPGTTPEDLFDWDAMCAAIAAAEPWWEPGARTGYHAQTFGYIVGEIVRRATGTSISRVLRDEVATPLGVADELFLAVPESQLGRVARLDEPAPPDVEQLRKTAPRLLEIVPPAVLTSAELCNRADYLTAEFPSCGTMSARAVARMFAAVVGEVDGVRLLTPEHAREVSTMVVDDVDQVFGNQARYALGYAMGRPVPDAPDPSTVIGWPGSGGCYAEADLATGTTFALTRTCYSADFAAVTRVFEVLGMALPDR
jgi:CubicO group peptidase (beta-lactamase class C family)